MQKVHSVPGTFLSFRKNFECFMFMMYDVKHYLINHSETRLSADMAIRYKHIWPFLKIVQLIVDMFVAEIMLP